MSTDIRTRAVAAFSALALASLLTTSAAIAATGTGFAARSHASAFTVSPTARLQAKPAHVAKVSAAIAMRGARRY